MTREDPDHPILAQPWRYTIKGLHYEIPDDGSEPFLDLTLELGAERRKLRFLSPRELEIEKGFPHAPGLVILDVSARGLDRLGVRVDDYEASWGGISFWARSVHELAEGGPSVA